MADSPNNPVWEIPGADRFIFNDGKGTGGWRIGKKSGLTTGRLYCQGKCGLMTACIINMDLNLHFVQEAQTPCQSNQNNGKVHTVEVKVMAQYR